jgi:hypothetical protein
VVVVGVKGSGKKFSDGKILKTTTVALYSIITTILFSYSGHLYNLIWINGIHIPQPPVESIDNLTLVNKWL